MGLPQALEADVKLPGPLVSTDWLASHLSEPDLRLFDTTVILNVNPDGPGYTPESGRARWQASHVPGAGFLDLIEDFSDRSTEVPFTMPEPEEFARRAATAGITDGCAVVAYSAGSMMWSTRLWWMLRSIGFDNAAVLDGGWDKWAREGRATNQHHEPYPQGRLSVAPRPALWADRHAVQAAIGDGQVCTLNALPADVYAGRTNRYGRPGHIPGSRSVFHGDLLEPATGVLLPPSALRARFEAVGALAAPRVIVYCGGGISATVDALALTLAGHPDVGVYDGSMWEWVADPSRPLTLGEAP